VKICGDGGWNVPVLEWVEEEDVESLETFPPQRPGCFQRSSSFIAASQRE